MKSGFQQENISFFEIPLPLPSALQQTYAYCLPEPLRDVAPSRKQDFIAGRYCAIQAAKKLGLIIHELPRSKTREPLWPEGIIGSISHSKQMAISCISRSEDYYSLGIDTEDVMLPHLAQDLAFHIATDKELELIRHLDLSFALTILFSAKEAFFKAIFPIVRSFVDFKEVELIALNTEHETFELEHSSTKKKYPGSFKMINQNVVTLVCIKKDQYVSP